MTTTREALEACPFCGGAATTVILADTAWVSCTECSSGTSAFCVSQEGGPKQADPWAAAKAWNRRSPELIALAGEAGG